MTVSSAPVEACRVEAERFYAMYKVGNPADPSSQFVIACMSAKGYDFTISPTDCDSRYPLVTQGGCYEPISWIDWVREVVGWHR